MGVITLVLGVLLTKIADNYDISMVLIAVGIPVFGVLALILSTWTTNSTNAYSAGLDIVMALGVPDHRRREVTIIAGLVGTVLGAVGILNRRLSKLPVLPGLPGGRGHDGGLLDCRQRKSRELASCQRI